MAKPILVANWKNHPGSLPEAAILLNRLSKYSRLYKKLSLFIAPPSCYFALVAERSRNFAKLASQDVSSGPIGGTYTGEITPDILKSFGVRLSIIGHSERRALGETDDTVSRKIKVAIHAGISPLVCVGELARDQDGEHFEFLRRQIDHSLAGLNKKDALKILIAYEPVWAVGKEAKGAIEPKDLRESVLFIKKVLSDLFGQTTAKLIPVLYGGSVDPENARELFTNTGIKGFLVGRVSLHYKGFQSLAQSLI